MGRLYEALRVRHACRRMTSLPPSKLDKTVAFLGAGNMAGALIKGLLASGVLAPEQVICTDVRKPRLEELKQKHGVRVMTSNEEAARAADVIVLATKPQVFDRLLPEVRNGVKVDALVVSIAAGIPIVAIEGFLPPGTRVVRTMPNTPAIVDAGATAIAAGTHANDDDVALARALFDSVGVTVVLDEYLLDAVTGLSGSGPAYIFLIIEALADAGVKVGLLREAPPRDGRAPRQAQGHGHEPWRHRDRGAVLARGGWPAHDAHQRGRDGHGAREAARRGDGQEARRQALSLPGRAISRS
jgi:pyrroline-5-carboxylate reductase